MKKPHNMPQEIWDNIIWGNLKGILGAEIQSGFYAGWPFGIALNYNVALGQMEKPK